MQVQFSLLGRRHVVTAAMAFFFVASLCGAHNITHILEKHPEFSTFNHYLTVTHLAPEINRRTTITVCAVDNAAMAAVLRLNTATAKNLLSVHVLLDYFGAKKLHQITNGTALAATLFQATGAAPGSAGFVNITDLRGGRVSLSPSDGDGGGGGDLSSSHFVKSVEEIPYNISVIHVSALIPSPSSAAAAPVPSPSAANITAVMSAHGCKAFSDAVAASDEAAAIFDDNAAGGLTVFCPSDQAFKSFLPKFKNLTKSGKASLLEFHGLPTYNSKAMLKSGNGVVNTLATDGAEKYDLTVQNDGDDVTLKTRAVTARITDTLLDQDPVAVFAIDEVLLPKELFKGVVEAPAPAPEKDADSPEPARKKRKKAADEEGDAPAPADAPADEDPADATADGNGGDRRRAQGLSVVGVFVAAFIGFFSI